MPPLGDGEDDGEAGGEAEGELPVTAETACDTGEATAAAAGEVIDDRGDDSAGAGPTPPTGHSRNGQPSYRHDVSWMLC